MGRGVSHEKEAYIFPPGESFAQSGAACGAAGRLYGAQNRNRFLLRDPGVSSDAIPILILLNISNSSIFIRCPPSKILLGNFKTAKRLAPALANCDVASLSFLKSI